MKRFTLLFVLPVGTNPKDIAVELFRHIGVCAYETTAQSDHLYMVVHHQTLFAEELGVDVGNVPLPDGGEWWYYHDYISTSEAVSRYTDPNYIPA